MSVKYSSTPFGLMLDYEVPAGCDVVALCVQQHQMVPVEICLPHQVYLDKIERILAEHATTEIHIIPYNSKTVLSFKVEDLIPPAPSLILHNRGGDQ